MNTIMTEKEQNLNAKSGLRIPMLLISSAYLPPVEYLTLIAGADVIQIEREENYLKQSYRNRCYILSAHGLQSLTVPVYMGSLHKTPLKDIRIDYSKRWQPVHLGAITAAYSSSPYFQFYFENIEKILSKRTEFLLDLNSELLEAILGMIKIKTSVKYTDHFEPAGKAENDFRYCISPKKQLLFPAMDYTHVFSCPEELTGRLSVIDLVFNMGPASIDYLQVS
jgi:hypothetical protein